MNTTCKLLFTAWLAMLSPLGAGSVLAQNLKWETDVQQAMVKAEQQQKMLLLHFTAEWCRGCQELDRFVFSSPIVARDLQENMIPVKVDVDIYPQLAEEYAVTAVPFDVVVTTRGRVVLRKKSPKTVGDYSNLGNTISRTAQLVREDKTSLAQNLMEMQQQLKPKANPLLASKSFSPETPQHTMPSRPRDAERLARQAGNSENVPSLVKNQFSTDQQQRSNNRAMKVSDPAAPPARQNNTFQPGSDKVRQQPSSKAVAPAATAPASNPLNRNFQASQALENPLDPLPANQRRPIGRVLPQASLGPPTDAIGPKEKVISWETGDGPALARHANAVPEQVAIEDETQMPTKPEVKQKQEDRSVPVQSSEKEYEWDSAPVGNQSDAAALADPDSAKSAPDSARGDFVAAATIQQDNSFQLAPQTGNANSAPASGQQAASILEIQKPVTEASNPANPNATSDRLPLTPVDQSNLSADKPVSRTPSAANPITEPTSSVEASLVVDGDSKPDLRIAAAATGARKFDGIQSGKPSDEADGVSSRALSMLQPLTEDGGTDQESSLTEKSQSPSAAGIPGQQTIPSSNEQPELASAMKGVSRAQIVTGNANSTGSDQVGERNSQEFRPEEPASDKPARFALQGKCPVTLMTQSQWVDGDKRFGCVHRGRTYLFASKLHLEAFLKSPDRFSPLLAGYDPVVFHETGTFVAGLESRGVFMGQAPEQRIVLFTTEENKLKFQSEPSRYLETIRQAMNASSSEIRR